MIGPEPAVGQAWALMTHATLDHEPYVYLVVARSTVGGHDSWTMLPLAVNNRADSMELREWDLDLFKQAICYQLT